MQTIECGIARVVVIAGQTHTNRAKPGKHPFYPDETPGARGYGWSGVGHFSGQPLE